MTKSKKAFLLGLPLLLLLLCGALLGRFCGQAAADRETAPNLRQAQAYADFFRLELYHYPNAEALNGFETRLFNHTFFFRASAETGEVVMALQNYIWRTGHEALPEETHSEIVAFLKDEDCDGMNYFDSTAFFIAPDTVVKLLELFPQEALRYISEHSKTLSEL